jgi:hypothetical protein
MTAKQTELTGLTIKTNSQPRRLIFTCELSETERNKVRQDYDWMDEDEFEDNCSWFKYQGRYYNLQEFMRCESGLLAEGWHGYLVDTYFSGILVKLRGDDLIVGKFFS